MDTRGRLFERAFEVMVEARISLRSRRNTRRWAPTIILRTPSSLPRDLISPQPPPRELRMHGSRREFRWPHRAGKPRNGLPAFHTRHNSWFCDPRTFRPCYFQTTESVLLCFEVLRRRTSWSSASPLPDVIFAKGFDWQCYEIYFFYFLSLSSPRELHRHKSLPAPSPKPISP